jgi:V/A-type H+-transporting ATPase subunit E
MSEQLQHLIERIRSEGVTKADAESRAILDKARAESERIEADAREKAAALIKKAESDANAYAERGRKALEQASRDTILTVRQAVEALFQRLFQEKTEAAFTADAFNAFLHDVVKTYLTQGRGAADITVPADQEAAVRDYFLKAFQDAGRSGWTIRSSNDVIKGFRVSFKDNHVEHDFTAEAIAETLGRLVRPDLADLLRKSQTP